MRSRDVQCTVGSDTLIWSKPLSAKRGLAQCAVYGAQDRPAELMDNSNLRPVGAMKYKPAQSYWEPSEDWRERKHGSEPVYWCRHEMILRALETDHDGNAWVIRLLGSWGLRHLNTVFASIKRPVNILHPDVKCQVQKWHLQKVVSMNQACPDVLFLEANSTYTLVWPELLSKLYYY